MPTPLERARKEALRSEADRRDHLNVLAAFFAGVCVGSIAALLFGGLL
jgi:hypothetical protein